MVTLTPMTKEQFEAYLERSIPKYAAENVRAGYWSEEEALEKSRRDFERLPPDGVEAKGHLLFQIIHAETNAQIGILWLNARTDTPRPSGFIYDIELDEAFRGKGFGRQTMLAVEEKARELGLKSIGLHVFAHNTAAKELYLKAGYQIKSYNMVKDLD
jgi:ribosomal protein S18 acetylase RimI-like enzyme